MNPTIVKRASWRVASGLFVATLLAMASACTASSDDGSSDDKDPAVSSGEGASSSTSEALSRDNCGSLGPSDIVNQRFRGWGRCCKGTYNTHGEAGGYCATNVGQINNLACRYDVRFCGGWGCASNSLSTYTGYCQAY